MSIHTLRENLKDIPGAHEIVMRYEDGTGKQIYSFGTVSVTLGAMATDAEIRAAIVEAMAH